ncbi:hypothetical protein [Bacillus sp. EB01]|uniref:hypothetical protein n=1 Tax=Bacillus sp. EB01 TaxID=1347086 RepID=UPI0005C77B3A|nr:hypothetical protein [Bacillus sp. EB01]
MNQEWIRTQTESTHHKMAIYLLPLVVFLGYFNPILYGIGILAFFLITSFKMLKSMLFWMLILGVISFALPFLAPIIFIVMIVLFFMRIGYVIENWRPFVSGLILYGILAASLARSAYLHSYYYSNPVVEAAVVSILGFIGLRFLLRWLYQYNYTSYAALGIMGSVPVIIIAFVLPFLKLHVGGDFFAAETSVDTTVETKPVGGEAYTETKLTTGEPISTRAAIPSDQPFVKVTDHVRSAPDATLTNNLSYHGSDSTSASGEIVHVKEHLRTTASGEVVMVKEHFRTASDGIISNNMSYEGPGSSASTGELVHVQEHLRTTPNGELIKVNEHLRTVPDGDPTNNFSFKNQTFNEVAVSKEPLINEPSPRGIVEPTPGTIAAQAAVDKLLKELKKKEEN